MYVLITILIIITCILLGLIVLVQNSKGGGLAAGFQSSNQYLGVRQTADFLEKTTWTLAIILLVLSLGSMFMIPRGGQIDQDKQRIEQLMQNGMGAPTDAPVAPQEGQTEGQQEQPAQPQE